MFVCVCVAMYTVQCSMQTFPSLQLRRRRRWRRRQWRWRRQQQWRRWASTIEIYAAWEKAKVKASTSKSIFVINVDYIRRFYSCFDIYLCYAVFHCYCLSFCVCVHFSLTIRCRFSQCVYMYICGSFYVCLALFCIFRGFLRNSLFNKIQLCFTFSQLQKHFFSPKYICYLVFLFTDARYFYVSLRCILPQYTLHTLSVYILNRYFFWIKEEKKRTKERNVWMDL